MYLSWRKTPGINIFTRLLICHFPFKISILDISSFSLNCSQFFGCTFPIVTLSNAKCTEYQSQGHIIEFPADEQKQRHLHDKPMEESLWEHQGPDLQIVACLGLTEPHTHPSNAKKSNYFCRFLALFLITYFCPSHSPAITNLWLGFILGQLLFATWQKCRPKFWGVNNCRQLLKTCFWTLSERSSSYKFQWHDSPRETLKLVSQVRREGAGDAGPERGSTFNLSKKRPKKAGKLLLAGENGNRKQGLCICQAELSKLHKPQQIWSQSGSSFRISIH